MLYQCTWLLFDPLEQAKDLSEAPPISRVNSHSDAGNKNLEMLSCDSPSLAPAITPVAGFGLLTKKPICSNT
ncbi:hypothetical protein Leryth_023189 [Lithospermum erythrorhizon]|nr:hypothetical protein Leryth_023189 [Lithospermum erythrorhizon]